MGRALTAAAALSATISAAPTSSAGEALEPIRVRVVGHPGCPGDDAFMAQVEARTRKARRAAPGEAARLFTLTVVQDGPVSRGRLLIDDTKGASAERAVSGQTCDEVVSAMALITALAVDPEQAYPASPAPPPPEPPAGAPPGTPGPATGTQPGLSPGSDTSPLVPAPDPRRPHPYVVAPFPWDLVPTPLPALPTGPSGEREPARWRVSVGVDGAALGAAAPRMMPSISLFADVQYRTDQVLSPSLRVSLTRADAGTVDTGSGTASFRLTQGRVDGCPIALRPIEQLGLAPCLAFAAGALEANGHGLLTSEVHTRPWAAVDLLGRIELLLGDLIRLEAEGGAVFPMVRDTFYFAPQITVHEVPAVGAFMGGGAGLYLR